MQPYMDEQYCKPAPCHTLPPHVLKENLHRAQLLVCPLPSVHEPNLLSAAVIANSPYSRNMQIYRRESKIRGNFPGASHLPAVALLAVS